MATPTPSGSRKPGGSGSTPSHLNQSSPPRSVPSPVTARHPAGKTPVNHSTTGSSSGSKTLAGTPMVQNLSQSGITSSPSTHLLGLGTPSGLGIEGATPAGLSGLTPALGSVPMMPTMSDLGLTPSGGKRNEDEERRMKMRKVLKSIGKDTGRVSEEGIARVARRVGFANDIDAEKLTPEEKERKVGNRPISTAGNAIVIEIDLKNQVPQNVQIMYSSQSKALEDHGARAGQVLLADLQAPAGIALNARLDRFAMNLERLARMDRLSSGGVNCFEAVSGLYASLERLYEQEKEAVKVVLKPGLSNLDEMADLEVMCKKSGKPLVHANGRIGVELAYWQENRHVRPADENRRASAPMDIDGQENEQDDKGEISANDIDRDQIFKLRIEVEFCSATMYPQLRTSDLWLPDPLSLPKPESGAAIPWNDPPESYMSSNLDQGGPPNRRFIATLDPPLVIPYPTAMNIQAALGTPGVFNTMQQYAQMLFDPTTTPIRGDRVFTTTAKQSVLSFQDGQETTLQHLYRLENARPDFGIRIEQLPFSHPRQLVELLPTLRQWAFVGSLLRATFLQDPSNTDQVASNGIADIDGNVNDSPGLSDLLKNVDKDVSGVIPVDIALVTAPTPSLGITFPGLNGGDVVNINIEVQANADITIGDCEGTPDISGHETDKMRKRETRLAKALDACGDLGVWVEWVRTQS